MAWRECRCTAWRAGTAGVHVRETVALQPFTLHANVWLGVHEQEADALQYLGM